MWFILYKLFFVRELTILLVALMFANHTSTAQKHYDAFVQIDVGSTISLADVKRYYFAPTTQGLIELRYGSGVETTVFMNDNLGINFDIHYYTLAGIDPDKQVSFTASGWAPSVSLSIAFNSFFGENLRSPWDRRFKLFGKLGYGHFFYNNELMLLDDFDAQNLQTDNYSPGKHSRGTSFFPVEVSLMYKLNKYDNQFFRREKDRLYLVASASIAFTDTDELDNYAGRDFSKDAFTYFSVGLSYFFGR